LTEPHPCEWPLSPLFYQDDQISDFPAPLSYLGIRLTRVAGKLYYDAITAYSCRP
jgi:hypothetical protein